MRNGLCMSGGLASLSALAVLAGVAPASVTTFIGFDPNAGPTSPRPISLAAQASWYSALAGLNVQCVDMESIGVGTPFPPNSGAYPLSPFLSFNPNTLGTMPTPVILNGASESIANGFDTTTPPPFNGQRLSLVGPFQAQALNLIYTFTFPPGPVRAFSMWITGEGNTVTGGQMHLTVVDSSGTTNVPIPATIGARFVGVTSTLPVSAIRLVVLSNGSAVQPFISIDDVCVVRFTNAGCNPDYNGDGFVNGDDFDLFVFDFESGKDGADYNGDGFISGDDFDQFVRDFENGC